MSRLILLIMAWISFLPAAQGQAIESDEFSVKSTNLRLTFSASGNLQAAFACFPACEGENPLVQLIGDDQTVSFEPFTGGAWSHSTTESEQGLVIRFEHSSGATTEWTVPQQGYVLRLKLDRPGDVNITSSASFRPRESAGFGTWLEQSRYLAIGDGDVTQVGFEEESEVTVSDSAWVGYRNRYWAFLAAPPVISEASLHTGEGRLDARLTIRAEPGTWSFYLGPVEPEVLRQAAAGLDIIQWPGLWFWLRWICLGLFYLLGWVHMAIPSWGLAVMGLSLIVSILIIPLTRIADRYQHEVNDTEARLAPELLRIKKNYKGGEQSERILELYKKENVHPLYSFKGMLGLAVVVPVFIGAFNMLAENIHLLNTSFLWIADLTRPDSLFTLPFRMPFFGADFNLLPFLMTVLTLVASWLHKPLATTPELRRRQVINMALMAVAFFVLFYTFPAGMVLYWTTNNLISVIKSLWARR